MRLLVELLDHPLREIDVDALDLGPDDDHFLEVEIGGDVFALVGQPVELLGRDGRPTDQAGCKVNLSPTAPTS